MIERDSRGRRQNKETSASNLSIARDASRIFHRPFPVYARSGPQVRS